MPLTEDLRRWTEAGLLTSDQATAIAAHEMATGVSEPPSTAPPRRSIGATEVVAYAGTVVILVGLSFLFGIQHDKLGPFGRLLILGLVVAAGMGTGFILGRGEERPSGRRARSAAFTIAVLATFGFLAEAFIDAHLLTRQPLYAGTGGDDSGNVALAAAGAALTGLALLLRARAGLVAVALAGCVYACAGAVVAFQRMQPGWTPEVVFLVGGTVLVASAEFGSGPRRGWATEILRFLGILPPVLTAIFMAYANGGLEAFAAGLSVLAFVVSIPRGSGGYALAGGVSLFAVVLEVGFRHFAQTLGFPVVLIASGLILLAVAVGLVRLLPRLAGRGRAGHLGSDGVDLGEQLGK